MLRTLSCTQGSMLQDASESRWYCHGLFISGLLSEKLAQEAAGFDVAAEPLRWNLCNQEFEDMCWYKEYQTINPGEVLSLRVQLPDDDWRVVSFPVTSLCTVQSKKFVRCLMDCNHKLPDHTGQNRCHIRCLGCLFCLKCFGLSLVRLVLWFRMSRLDECPRAL